MSIVDFKAEVSSSITTKTDPNSISPQDVGNCFSDLADLIPISDSSTGLELSISGSYVIVNSGSWSIGDSNFTSDSLITLGLNAQDPTGSRYDVVYADSSGSIDILSGNLSITPVEPDAPDNSIILGSVFITPTAISLNLITGSYVTTNTNQSGLFGQKRWSQKHFFKQPPQFHNIPTGSLIHNLGVDNSGNLIIGSLTSGSSYTFNNGLTVSGSNTIQLGGTLNQTTLINGGIYSLLYSGTSGSYQSALAVANNGFTVAVSPDLNTSSFALLTTPNASTFGTTGATIGYKHSGSFSILNITTTSMSIIDSVNAKGLYYGADYSLNSGINPRWIPDAGWVSASIAASSGSGGGLSGSYSFSNGLTISGSSVTLGGAITVPTIFTLNNHPFSIVGQLSPTIGAISPIFGLGASVALGVQTYTSASLTDYYTYVFTANSSSTNGIDKGAFVGVEYVTPTSSHLNVGLIINESEIKVQDDINNLGMTYSTNYSVSGSSNPRWIPDIGYVSSLISNQVIRETPSGSINGINTTFTLVHIPKINTECLYLNGLLQEPGAGNDYTITGSVLTILTAPSSSDRLRINYNY